MSNSNSECTANRNEYRKDSQLSVSSCSYGKNYDFVTNKEQLSHSTGVQFSNEYTNKPWYFAKHNDVKWKRESYIIDANGELLNHPFSIVNSVATRNIAHNTEDEIAESSQSWQNLHQQQLLGNNLVRNEIENNIEPNHFVQQYRTNTINDCNSASVNQLLGLPKSDKKYTADHLQLNHRPPATTIYNNNNNHQNETSQLPGPTFAMFNDNSSPNLSQFAQ